MQVCNGGRGWVKLSGFPSSKIVRRVFEETLNVINEAVSPGQVLANQINFATKNGDIYDKDHCYFLKIPSNDDTQKEDTSVSDHYKLETLQGQAMSDFMCRYVLWISNKMGICSQLVGYPDYKPMDKSVPVVFGDMNRHVDSIDNTHLSLGGMSLLFGGHPNQRSNIIEGGVVHQPPHYDGSYDEQVIETLKELNLAQPFVTMFPLNKDRSCTIYICKSMEDEPVIVSIG